LGGNNHGTKEVKNPSQHLEKSSKNFLSFALCDDDKSPEKMVTEKIH